MAKKNKEEELREFSISVKGKYSANRGVEEMEEVKVQGSKQILVSVCLGLVKELCIQANASYTELLSNTIKQEVFAEAVKKAEEMQKKEEEENGK